MLVSLLNVPRTAEDWSVWAYANKSDHDEIVQAIQAQGGPHLNQYTLYPVDPEHPEFFLETNDKAHAEMNDALGLSGSDLQTVDFKDERQLAAWIILQYTEHYYARAKLGI